MTKIAVRTADPNDLEAMFPGARPLPDGTRPLIAQGEFPITRTFDGNRVVAFVLIGGRDGVRAGLLLEGERGEAGEDLSYDRPATYEAASELVDDMRAMAAELTAGRMPEGFKRIDQDPETKIRPFSSYDWDAYAGAESWPEGANPLIAGVTLGGPVEGKGYAAAVIIGDARGVQVELFEREEPEGELNQTPVYNRPSTGTPREVRAEMERLIATLKSPAPDLTDYERIL